MRTPAKLIRVHQNSNGHFVSLSWFPVTNGTKILAFSYGVFFQTNLWIDHDGYQDKRLTVALPFILVLEKWNTNSSTISNTLDFLWTPNAQQERQLFVWIWFINHSCCDLNIQDRCWFWQLNVIERVYKSLFSFYIDYPRSKVTIRISIISVVTSLSIIVIAN